jgi:hypothetical protein
MEITFILHYRIILKVGDVLGDVPITSLGPWLVLKY